MVVSVGVVFAQIIPLSFSVVFWSLQKRHKVGKQERRQKRESFGSWFVGDSITCLNIWQRFLSVSNEFPGRRTMIYRRWTRSGNTTRDLRSTHHKLTLGSIDKQKSTYATCLEIVNIVQLFCVIYIYIHLWSVFMYLLSLYLCALGWNIEDTKTLHWIQSRPNSDPKIPLLC